MRTNDVCGGIAEHNHIVPSRLASRGVGVPVDCHTWKSISVTMIASKPSGDPSVRRKSSPLQFEVRCSFEVTRDDSKVYRWMSLQGFEEFNDAQTGFNRSCRHARRGQRHVPIQTGGNKARLFFGIDASEAQDVGNDGRVGSSRKDDGRGIQGYTCNLRTGLRHQGLADTVRTDQGAVDIK
jgi:hypothetical protein